MAIALTQSERDKIAANFQIERARMRSALGAMTDIAGFDYIVRVMQAELQSLAQRERSAGRSTGGYIG